jgi:hypothetical protein
MQRKNSNLMIAAFLTEEAALSGCLFFCFVWVYLGFAGIIADAVQFLKNPRTLS